jgi:hypothetical protein
MSQTRARGNKRRVSANQFIRIASILAFFSRKVGAALPPVLPQFETPNQPDDEKYTPCSILFTIFLPSSLWNHFRSFLPPAHQAVCEQTTNKLCAFNARPCKTRITHSFSPTTSFSSPLPNWFTSLRHFFYWTSHFSASSDYVLSRGSPSRLHKVARTLSTYMRLKGILSSVVSG